MKIFRNLTEFEDPSLTQVSVGGIKYLTRPDANPSAILVQAFGCGKCNNDLKWTAMDARDYFTTGKDFIPIIGQYEAIGNLPEREVYCVNSKPSIERGLVQSAISTPEILARSKRVMEERKLDLKRVVYVAHPAHMERVIAIGKKLGLEGVAFVSPNVVWSDENDPQWWTSDADSWVFREILTRIHHTIKGLA